MHEIIRVNFYPSKQWYCSRGENVQCTFCVTRTLHFNPKTHMRDKKVYTVCEFTEFIHTHQKHIRMRSFALLFNNPVWIMSLSFLGKQLIWGAMSTEHQHDILIQMDQISTKSSSNASSAKSIYKMRIFKCSMQYIFSIQIV